MPDFIRRKIESSKSVAETLKNTRKKKGYSLEDAETETKVRIKYLEALEEGRYDILPGNVYTQGFLIKYADYLDLNKEKLLTQFKAERGDKEKVNLVPERRIKERWFFITPKIITVGIIVLFIIGVLGYIVYSVRNFTQPPNLLISQPSSEQILKEDKVNIIGKTDAGATLEINGQAVLLDGNGNFTQQVKLNSGLNTFEIRAINRLKKVKIVQVKILAEF